VICAHPLYLKPVGVRLLPYQVVGCGRCGPCRAARAIDWGNRMLWEVDYHPSACFVTLTFSEEVLAGRQGPDSLRLSVSKRELQLFVKRLRKELGDRVVRYFACGEYGERFGRPHYHVVFFGVGVVDREIIEACWPYGFVDARPFAVERARYTASYLLKEVDESIDLFGREPPFALMSKGLGRRFALSQVDRIESDRPLTVAGKVVRVPRYFRKVVDSKPDLSFLAEDFKLHGLRTGHTIRTNVGRWAIQESMERSRSDAANSFEVERLMRGGSDGL